MVDGIIKLIPAAKVGHVGLYRDPETLKPVEYYVKIPSDLEEREFIVVDPMLATGGSAIEAIHSIKKRGAKHIKFMCLIAAPEGVEALKEAHPDVDIYIAGLDEKLNDMDILCQDLETQATDYSERNKKSGYTRSATYGTFPLRMEIEETRRVKAIRCFLIEWGRGESISCWVPEANQVRYKQPCVYIRRRRYCSVSKLVIFLIL